MTRRRPPGVFRRAATATAAGALALAGAIALPATPAQADTTASGDVIANLWEWNWDSIASECTNVLGPAGYGAVQVAPPAESLKQSSYYWWDVYQPYSYNLNSRFGTAAKFASMVSACHTAGVKVYTDAVINHTAAQTGTGYNGTTITNKYDTPDWDPGDYHQSDDCSDSDLIIDDYSNLSEVQNCELLGLPDLETEEDNVRSGIASFLNKQIALGVDGFRVDAAKHIPETDMAAIEAKLNDTTSGTDPYVFQEIYPGSTPAASDYYASGDVLDFTYASKMKSAFQGNVSDLESLSSSGILPAANSVSFVTNHDTERNGLHMSYKDGDSYKLANLFQLAYKWSTPTIYAGWEFSTSDQAPPNSSGFVTDTECTSGAWYCLDRDTGVVGMVAWHNATGSAAVSNWSTKSSSVIGFGRSGAGYFAVNNGSSAATYTFATGMADGTYSNVIDGGASTVTVSGGSASITVQAKGAVAFYNASYTCTVGCDDTGDGGDSGGTSTVSATFNEYASTTTGTNVYVVGSIDALGSWDTSKAIALSSTGYPIWSGEVSVPINTSFTYKYIKKDSSGNVTWESNANRAATTASSAVSLNNSWNVADAGATDVTFNEYATTDWGTNVYVVGSVASLGSWSTSDAIPLSSASYPTWSKLVIVPKSTTFTYKYIKKDSSGNVTWESGTNRSYTTGTSSGYTASDTWK
ncbi:MULTISPECIES: carbohydrate-binding module family 20 domain-containing protein [unclassified Streptomyces]|uniref:carbohydrate-binding module family 20 domain-containing protein n=1 Tax=unclassified Streptomyces TaxID=2593676 RepID=UPI002E81F6F8|nr:carbohydrate-binding module family 20 domain-containing protein [Streptomyces sp. NBC_00589]WTI39766.1 alpha-amylase family glycosyl hydrolase [Streptomyces sp. NBC_00775]WUB26555.1 alpha-amylase family glycosyl hydrolase [Streptomyces sp. NBC_00589]